MAQCRPFLRALIAPLILAGMLALPGYPAARADESQYEAFYAPPASLPPGHPGDMIRSEPSRLVLEPSGQLGGYVATGTRIMYRSTDIHNTPTAVTGTYFEPDNPWLGAGPRPLIAFAPGMYGIGDQCAPSRLFNQGIHYGGGADLTVGYEETFIATMVARGFAVVVTDYEGVGTGGPATPFLRLPQGYALIDAARAAMRLTETSLDPHGPVAFWGYGQGGGAAAAAVELAPSYAPDLRVVGAWAGAPSADLALIPPFAEGSIFAGGLGYLLNAIGGAYPDLAAGMGETLTDKGVTLLEQTRNECVGETVMRFAFRHYSQYFTSDYMELIAADPLRSVLAAQRIGRLKPAAPVFINSNRYDPFIPYEGARQLAVDWCAKGADVQFWTNEQPPFFNKLAINFLLPYFVDGERGMQWIADRFNGLPTESNCHEI
ncbi:lipase family protein [Mycobacteroides sp. LB1]|uniref:lipase family protein n=1 Tax=Mycobacteroides sp. LB1 TaxID=2750814 RepID=UPI0015DD9685|nr:alpha/beta fold hydrolase [Mycobacteroides sp. LB1]